MPIFKAIEENEAQGKVKEIYDEIKKVRQIDKIPNFWKQKKEFFNRVLQQLFSVVPN